ncbi:MAG: PAS domain S-box protein [Desulfovibrionaceae bacterium]|nr:PAS domain S-box protein [Desulfovibrionaceae bacterium]
MKKRLIFLVCVLSSLAVAAAAFFVFRAEEASHRRTLRAEVLHGLSDVKTDLVMAVSRKMYLVRTLESAIRIRPMLTQREFDTLMFGMLDRLHAVRSVRLVRDGVVTHSYPYEDGAGHVLEADDPAFLHVPNAGFVQAGRVRIVYSGRGGGRPSGMAVVAPVDVRGGDGDLKRWGLIVVSVDVDRFMTMAGLPGRLADVRMALRVPGPVQGRLLTLSGDPLVFDMEPLRADVRFFSQVWQLAAAPEHGWYASPASKYILGGGVILALLVPASLWMMLSVLMGRFEDRKKYRYLVETAKAIILRLDLTGQVEFCNEYAEQFYGYGHGELVGKPLVGTLIPEKGMEGQSMKRYIGKLLMNPSAHPFNETMNLRKNGEIVWVAWANQPVLADDGTMVGLLCVGTDITDRKLMEESLRQREKQYRLLAENVSDIIWGLDADLRYTYVSPSDEGVRGFKRYEVLGRSIGEFLTPAARTRLDAVLAVLGTSPGGDGAVTTSATEDLEFYCADGSLVWLESKLGLMLNEDGVRIGIQGVSRDITDRKRAEALREDMERMAKHDLKTPLGAVIGLPGEIRRAGPVTPEQDALLETVENAGGAMLALINRSLDLYKMECGTLELHRSPVDVVEVIERIKVEAQPHIRSKGISIGIEIADGDGPFLVQADAGLFQSMLSNMLLNALEASPESGTVSIILAGGSVPAITIRNKGEVPPDMREVFFEKYATGNKASGSGLGTYSARLIARTHGGDITVDTARPGETGVTITLPSA